ncbi:MAG: MFS transporter, partial [Cyanobacteria bacterium]|nr:MFS transporter [Cyanobacteriota bacterium]
MIANGSTSYSQAIEDLVAIRGEATRWLIMFALSVAALLDFMDVSIINVAIPNIQGNLGATLSEVGWVVTGYTIANAILVPL